MTLPDKLFQRFHDVFSLDLRALAVFRVLLGGLVIADMVRRLGDFTAHYTDSGIFTIGERISHLMYDIAPSVHLLSGESWFQLGLFAATIVSAACMLVGYRTRFFTIVTWFLVLSLQTANQYYNNSGDDELLLLLFWAMFLPLGAVASVDRALQEKEKLAAYTVTSIATVGLTLQVVYVYFSAFFHKSGEAWKVSFRAVEYAFSIDQHATAVARYLLQFSDWLFVLTVCTVALQLVSLPLMLSPWARHWSRNLVVTALIGMHVSFIVTLYIGIFPFVSICGLLVLYTSVVWNKLQAWHERQIPIQIYYDQPCGFCRRSVWLITTLGVAPAQIAEAQSDPDILTHMRTHDSWVVIDAAGNKHVTFGAGVEIARRSLWLWPLVYLARLPGVWTFGEWMYRFVATRRADIPLPVPKKELTIPADLRPLASFVAFAFLSFVIVLSMFTNLTDVVYGHPKYIAQDVLVKTIGLSQDWDVFAPTPMVQDSWPVVVGTTATGEQFDIWSDQPVDFYTKPDTVTDVLDNQRWRKFLSKMPYDYWSWQREPFLLWVCSDWNHPQQESHMQTAALWIITEQTTPAGEGPLVPQFFGQVTCGD